MEEPYMRCVGKKDADGNPIIEYSDNSVKVFRDYPEEIDCRSCGTHVSNLRQVLEYSGFCRECYPQVMFNVPSKIPNNQFTGIESWVWTGRVSQTSDTKNTFGSGHYGADIHGNNFAISDAVIYNPDNDRENKKIFMISMEGIVTDLHRYSLDDGCYFDDFKGFLAAVFFNKENQRVLIHAKRLEALTCNHLALDNRELAKFEGKLDSMSCSFDPMNPKHKLKKVFSDPVSRAVWMSYRSNHILDQYSVERIKKVSLEISRDLKKNPLPRDRIHLWFKRKMAKFGFRDIPDEQIACLVPYLAGSRKAGYKVIEKTLSS
ncbi:MAG: hypothetical protein ABH840_01950 [Nanoarchaeota archaeon]